MQCAPHMLGVGQVSLEQLLDLLQRWPVLQAAQLHLRAQRATHEQGPEGVRLWLCCALRCTRGAALPGAPRRPACTPATMRTPRPDKAPPGSISPLETVCRHAGQTRSRLVLQAHGPRSGDSAASKPRPGRPWPAARARAWMPRYVISPSRSACLGAGARQLRRSSGRAASCRPAAAPATSRPLVSRNALSAATPATVVRESSLRRRARCAGAQRGSR